MHPSEKHPFLTPVQKCGHTSKHGVGSGSHSHAQACDSSLPLPSRDVPELKPTCHSLHSEFSSEVPLSSSDWICPRERVCGDGIGCGTGVFMLLQ